MAHLAAQEAGQPLFLPHFPESIFAAISALSDTNDTSESAIEKYITQYVSFPEEHEGIIAVQLEKMKQSGQLLLSDDGNYSRPPRSRGRPPKTSLALCPGAVPAPATPPRPRGRHPKRARPFPPPFREMIFAAICDLSDTNESSKSAIVKYIETQFANLSAVIAEHLDKMEQSGLVSLSDKGNYALRDSRR